MPDASTGDLMSLHFLCNIAILGACLALASRVGYLMWIDSFRFLRWPRRRLCLSHCPDPRAQLEQQVAERVRTEEELRQSESRFRTIFDNTRDVITYVDTHGRLLAVNGRVEEVFGYRPEELVGRRFTTLGILRIKDIPRMAWLFRRTILRGQPTEIVELELKHRNGDSVWVEVGTRFVRRNHRVTEVVNVFRDITERKRKDAQLAHLSAIVDSFPDAVIGAALDGIITSWNAGVERLYGHLAEEAVGRSIAMILPTCRHDAVQSMLAEVERRECAVKSDVTHRRKDGTLIYVSLTLSPLTDVSGRMIGALSVARHIRDLALPSAAGNGSSAPVAIAAWPELQATNGTGTYTE